MLKYRIRNSLKKGAEIFYNNKLNGKTTDQNQTKLLQKSIKRTKVQ
jgi:hypothetical protein